MKRTARMLQLFALTFLFLFTSAAATHAYPSRFDFSLGRGFKRSYAPIVSPATTEFHAAALSAPAAMPLMNSGANDYMSDVSHEGIYTWEADKLPIKIYISNGAGVPGYRPQFGQFIRSSFDTWVQASGNKLSWVEVADPNKADLTVIWTDKVTERPEGTEAGKTSCFTKLNTMTGRGIIYGARMQLMTRLPGREFGDPEVAKTCLHEAGHAFGLQGHSTHRDDIMFYAVSNSQEFQLTDRDKATMSHLYQNFPVGSGLAVGPKPAQN